ncbi:unnamed protein product [Ophioblennius macclurei]
MKRLSSRSSSEHLVLCVFFSLLLGVADSTTSSPTISTVRTTIKPPEDVSELRVVNQTENSITLEWKKVDGIATYQLRYDDNGTPKIENISDTNPTVQHVVSKLTAGTLYNFTIFTMNGDLTSKGHSFDAATAPQNVKNLKVVNQNETSLTLRWDKVNGIGSYILVLNEKNMTIDASATSYTISSLTSGTEYIITFFTKFSDVLSSGVKIPAATAPQNVQNLKVKNQNETSITLQWSKVDGIDSYILVPDKEEDMPIDKSQESYTISDLESMTEYSFTLFTVFETVRSSGERLTAATAPQNVKDLTVVTQNETSLTLRWDKVNGIDSYILVLNEKNMTIDASATSYTISSLTSGTEYIITFFTEFSDVLSSGVKIPAVTAPQNVQNLKVENQNETSITLRWDKVDGISGYFLVTNTEEKTIGASEMSYTISDLESMTEYSFTLFTQFRNVNSSGESLTAVTAPRQVQNGKATTQTETSITLAWDTVTGIDHYIVVTHTGDKTINASEVPYTISGLMSGTEYKVTVIAVFKEVRSAAVILTVATVPPAVEQVEVIERTLTAITLRWISNNTNWTYVVKTDPQALDNVSILGDLVRVFVVGLKPGTKHTFNVITVLEGEHYRHRSEPFTVDVPTVIDCSAINWRRSSTSIEATVDGVFTTATLKDKTGSLIAANKTVSFNGLYPGETYQISLEYEVDAAKSFSQCEQSLTLFPSDPVGRCEYAASGYSVRVVWEEPHGVCTQAEVSISGTETLFDCKTQFGVVTGFQPAKTYKVSLVLLSGDERSRNNYVFNCHTDPRGVIAGSVMGVLIFLVICVALFIFLRRPDMIRGKKSIFGGSRPPTVKAKVIPVTKFQDHFSKLSADENRGFSLEYASLSHVGADQSQNVATQPENKARNRFTNVLPYDSNRVKLTASASTGSSDYINASYMPGYNSSRDYIATQGPLPGTVGDFWRMIWEQQVKGVVMVTNCVELGRTKCEQYWPPVHQSRPFGELVVTTTSEQKEPNWTLRTFGVTNKNTSEERTVEHFHFTAWPDHGVPQNTEILLDFRERVRQHIGRNGGRTPTVVHCSAGVGRTGTIIALDVLLQQLESEQAVGINSFVHRMRLSRPYMVQTESQYVFLHQCILDSLRTRERIDEHIYENTNNMIYVNATALQEFHQHNQN